MERRETEFKLLLTGVQDVAALRAVLPGDAQAPARAHAQVNHFFDTPAGAFAAAGSVLRLRSEDGTWTLTAKGPALDPDGEAALSQRAEEECSLPVQAAQAILAGDAAPLAPLLERCEGQPAALLARLRDLNAGCALTHIGSFENQRTPVGPVLLEDLEQGVTFEFDRTLFPGGRVDWEVEVEVPSAAASAAGRALRALFERASLEWRPATPKAARFFALARPTGH